MERAHAARDVAGIRLLERPRVDLIQAVTADLDEIDILSHT